MPQDVFAIFRQGKLLLKLGNLSFAYQALSAAADAAPDFPSFLAYKAFMQSKAGEHDGSADTCVRALNRSLLDFRAAAVLKSLPPPVRARHTALLSRVAAAEEEAHKAGGHASAEEINATLPCTVTANVKSLAFVTSANSLYFQCVSNLVGSLQLREPAAAIDLFDMGLDDLERLVARSWANVEVVTFPFERFPPHMRNLRNYAWKPLVYALALQRHSTILYQDAGQELWGSAGLIEDLIQRDGAFFVMQGEKTLPSFVHPQMLKAVGVSEEEMRGRDMCAGGIQGYRNDSVAVREVLENVVLCALNARCIAPRGADQSNHRFDQAAFSLLLAKHNYRCHCSWRFRAYLERNRLSEADKFDVADGFGRLRPLLFSRRCDTPQSYYPLSVPANS